jgi:hypothetical protein
MSILFRHRTHLPFFRDYARLLTRFIQSPVATKDCHTITKHARFLKTNLVSRCFHSSLVHNSSCDSGGACACSECMQARRQPICEICKLHPTAHQTYEFSWDRRGVRGYSLTLFCEQCWQKRQSAERETERKREQILALNKGRVDSMLEVVQKIRSTDQIPIAYAVDKLISNVTSVESSSKSRRWFQRYLIDRLSHELQIVKTRNKYTCNKRRVDAMDFKLWYFRGRIIEREL